MPEGKSYCKCVWCLGSLACPSPFPWPFTRRAAGAWNTQLDEIQQNDNRGRSHHTSELPNIVNNHFASVGKYHIGHITSKISKTVGIIARLRYYVPTSVLLRIYQSLMFPYLSYGIVVWGHAAQTYINQILVLQKRALRLIYFTSYRSHAIPLFISSNTIPINMLYFKSVSILMHDVFNKQTPCNISDLFNCSNELHNYNTRFSLAGNCYIKYSRFNHLLKSFSRQGAKIWNSIPQELRKVPKFVFKANLQNRLLVVLMEEDDYTLAYLS